MEFKNHDSASTYHLIQYQARYERTKSKTAYRAIKYGKPQNYA